MRIREKPAGAWLIRAGRLLPWRTAAEIIDWTIACPSIFDTPAEIMVKHGVRAVQPLADAMRRIARGVVRYIFEANRPFIVPIMHQGDSRSNPIDEPLATVTANSFVKRPGGAAPLGVVTPCLVPRYGEREGQDPRKLAAEEPMPTIVPTGNEASLAAVRSPTSACAC